jgi:hypothetical protein
MSAPNVILDLVKRELLAKNLASRNPSLTQRELNYAVQVTIDRIIFHETRSFDVFR